MNKEKIVEFTESLPQELKDLLTIDQFSYLVSKNLEFVYVNEVGDTRSPTTEYGFVSDDTGLHTLVQEFDGQLVLFEMKEDF